MATREKANYLSNTHLLAELEIYRETNIITDRLAKMFMLLAQRVSRHRWFIGYTFRDEMIQEGIFMCVAKVGKFNVTKGKNAFAYFSQIIWNSYRQFCMAEKKQQDIRDTLLLEHNLDPSFRCEDEMTTQY